MATKYVMSHFLCRYGLNFIGRLPYWPRVASMHYIVSTKELIVRLRYTSVAKSMSNV